MATEKQETNKSQIVHSLSSDQHSDMTKPYDLRFINSPTLFNNFQPPPPMTNPIIIIDDDDEVTPEPPKKKTKLGFFNYPMTFNDSGSLISNNSIIIQDEETIDPWKNNETRLGFGSGYVDPFDELGVVVRGLTKTKEDFASKFDSYFPPTDDLNENKNNENSNIILEPQKNNETKLGLGGSGCYVDPFDELSKVVKGFQKRKEENKGFASVTDVNEKKENEKVPESKGYRHWLYDLEISDEDLESNIPLEAFDPTEMERYIKDLISIPWEEFDPTSWKMGDLISDISEIS